MTLPFDQGPHPAIAAFEQAIKDYKRDEPGETARLDAVLHAGTAIVAARDISLRYRQAFIQEFAKIAGMMR